MPHVGCQIIYCDTKQSSNDSWCFEQVTLQVSEVLSHYFLALTSLISQNVQTSLSKNWFAFLLLFDVLAFRSKTYRVFFTSPVALLFSQTFYISLVRLGVSLEGFWCVLLFFQVSKRCFRWLPALCDNWIKLLGRRKMRRRFYNKPAAQPS